MIIVCFLISLATTPDQAVVDNPDDGVSQVKRDYWKLQLTNRGREEIQKSYRNIVEKTSILATFDFANERVDLYAESGTATVSGDLIERHSWDDTLEKYQTRTVPYTVQFDIFDVNGDFSPVHKSDSIEYLLSEFTDE